MLPTERIGAYRVVKKLATGTTTDVLLASAEGPHGFARTVVLKRLVAPYKDDERFAKSFAREAAAYAKLHDPRIVTLHDFLTLEGGDLVMVLEHVDGAPLDRVQAMAQAAGAEIDDTVALHVAAEVFAALAVAHGAGEALVHRDVNPSNVLLGWTGHVKLADFGLVKATRAPSTVQHESIAPLLGITSEYLAPEQRRGEKVSPAADVYSAALVVWELLARSRSASIDDEAVRPDLDAHVRRLLRVALSSRVEDRTATAAEIAKTFSSIAGPVDGRERLAQLLAKIRPVALPPVEPTMPTVPKPASVPKMAAIRPPVPKPASVPRMPAVPKPPSTPKMVAVRPPVPKPTSNPKLTAVKASTPKIPVVNRDDSQADVPTSEIDRAIVDQIAAEQRIAAPAIRESRRPPPSFTELPSVQKTLVLDLRQASVPDADTISAALEARMAEAEAAVQATVDAAVEARIQPEPAPPPAPKAKAEPVVLPDVSGDDEDEEAECDEEEEDQAVEIPGIGRVQPRSARPTRWGARCAVAALVVGAAVFYAHRTGRVHIAQIDVASRWFAARFAAPAPPPPVAPPAAPPAATASAEPTPPPPVEPIASAPAPAPTSDVGTIKTTEAAPWRRIFVDDKTVGQTPAAVSVKCGTHAVRLGSGGHTQTIEVPCGGEIEVGDR